jgi:transcriptional regulator with XRE-family HTH domain
MEKNITKLRRIRKEKGFKSHRRLSEACGLSEQCVYWWEIGLVKPRPYNAKRLETILQTPASVLLEPEIENGAETKSPSPIESSPPLTREERSKRHDKY